MKLPEDEDDLTVEELTWLYDQGRMVRVENLARGTLIVNPIPPANALARTVNDIRVRLSFPGDI